MGFVLHIESHLDVWFTGRRKSIIFLAILLKDWLCWRGHNSIVAPPRSGTIYSVGCVYLSDCLPLESMVQCRTRGWRRAKTAVHCASCKNDPPPRRMVDSQTPAKRNPFKSLLWCGSQWKGPKNLPSEKKKQDGQKRKKKELKRHFSCFVGTCLYGDCTMFKRFRFK